jgi:hypothetical protein
VFNHRGRDKIRCHPTQSDEAPAYRGGYSSAHIDLSL